MSKKWFSLGAAFILLMTMVFYIPAIRGGYIWDDDQYVTNNLTLRTLDGLRRIWLEIGAVPQYYPLVHTSFWVEYHLWQSHPLGYHMVNVLLHALNATLLWLVLRRLGIAGAWLAATIFALHPVHVESVAWITERKNILSGFFYLSAVLFYLRFLRWDRGLYSTSSQSTKHSSAKVAIRYQWGFYAMALGLYLCALFSKTVTCTMPVMILLLLWWKQGRIGYRNLLPLIPYFLVGAALGLTTVWVEKHHVGAQGEEWTFSLVERCLVAGRALWFYVGKLFWPYNLTFIYPRWYIDAGVWWQYLYPLAAVAVFIALWLLRRKIGKAPLVGVFFFAGTLAPALGFFDIYPLRFSFVADHFQYLASIGIISLSAAVLATLLLNKSILQKIMGIILCGIILFMLGILVWHQGHIYKNEETLWRDTISKNSKAWIAYTNLGGLLYKQGKLDEGMRCFEHALDLNPSLAEAYCCLGAVYSDKNMADQSISMCKKALAINPYMEMAHANLGMAYYKKGMLDEAISACEKAIILNQNYGAAHYNLGMIYRKKGMVDEAIAEYTRALTIEGHNANLHTDLGIVYSDKNMIDEAISSFKTAISLDPNYAMAYNNVGLAYYNKGMLDEAISEYKKALSINPNLAEAHYNISVAYYYRENYKLAIIHCDKAVELGCIVYPKLLELLKSYR